MGRNGLEAVTVEKRKLTLIGAGSAMFTVGDQQVRGEPGTAMFIPAGTSHRIHNDRDEVLHLAWGFNRGSLTEVGFVWDE